MHQTKILIVDDELIIRESLAGWLERDGHHVDTSDSGEACLDILKQHRFDILLVDIKMDGISGMDVLKHVKEHYPDIDVIMITAFGSIPSSVEAMKAGAYDYLLKPFDPNELGVLIEKLIDHQARKRENQYLREEVREQNRFESMIGQAPAMQKVFKLIRDIRETKSTVLITGETGTGKGMAAKAVHTSSPLKEGPFVSVNCGAIPLHIMESELFGHQKGAFTDAKETRKGRLEMACGGTLFLDEIGEVPMRMQIDLLHVLEDRVFYKVGGTQPITGDFRVIAATNSDLEQAIRDRTFREDLFYRLNVISFTMPPLRNRREDIPILAHHFLQKFSREINKPVERIDREAMDELMLYRWPGNVRELSNAMERAVVVSKARTIGIQDLPITSPTPPNSPDCTEKTASAPPSMESTEKNTDTEKREYSGSFGTLSDMEKVHIKQTLDANLWNISRSAAQLGIDRSTLYSKIKRYQLKNSNR